MFQRLREIAFGHPSVQSVLDDRVQTHQLELVEAEAQLRAAQARVDYHRSVLEFLTRAQREAL